MNKELILALDALEKENGISKEVMLDAIEKSLMNEYKAKMRIEESRFALIACTIANCNRSRGSKPYSIEDFMSKGTVKKKTADELYQTMRQALTK